MGTDQYKIRAIRVIRGYTIYTIFGEKETEQEETETTEVLAILCFLCFLLFKRHSLSDSWVPFRVSRMVGKIEITVGDVNDVEARVYARYTAPIGEPVAETEPIILQGTLRGPYCETARTLPAVFMFHAVPSASLPTGEALVPDPCVWSHELPHLYQADVVAQQGEQIVAEYHGTIGFRRADK